MKKLISIIIAIFSLGQVLANAEEPVLVEYKDVQGMWELVELYSPNDMVTAAVVSVISYESNCCSNIFGGGYLRGKHYDETATAEIDAGLEDGSTKDDWLNYKWGWGYGLLQWVVPYRIEDLYEYAQDWGTSIGDTEMQVSFIFWELETTFSEEYEIILSKETAADTTYMFAALFEGTSIQEKLSDRAYLATQLYEEYGEEEIECTTENGSESSFVPSFWA